MPWAAMDTPLTCLSKIFSYLAGDVCFEIKGEPDG